MIRTVPTLVALLFGAVNAAAAQQPPAWKHFQLERLHNGVWAAIASDSGYAISNAGIIDLGDATVVFDPFISPEPAEELRRAAEALTGRPVAFVVLSHGHNDHIRGTQAFPGAVVIASEGTRKWILGKEPDRIAHEREHVEEWLERTRRGFEAERDPERRREAGFWVAYYEAIARSLPTLQTVPPSLTFEGKLVLHGPDRRIELIETGRGHSDSDLVLHLPEERIAFLGDLLFIGRHPFLPDGFPEDWTRVLLRVHALDPERVVPGHGPVGGRDALTTMVAYIEDLEALGAELAREGRSSDEAARAPVPAHYASWWYGRFFPANVRFTHARAVERLAPLGGDLEPETGGDTADAVAPGS